MQHRPKSGGTVRNRPNRRQFSASNTFASFSGYLSGAYAFRKELRLYKDELPKFFFVSLIGDGIGAWPLLQTPGSLFREAIPWLLLLATFLFALGKKPNKLSKTLASQHQHDEWLKTTNLIVCIVDCHHVVYSRWSHSMERRIHRASRDAIRWTYRNPCFSPYPSTLCPRTRDFRRHRYYCVFFQ